MDSRLIFQQLLIHTVKDPQKLFPCVETNVSVSEFEGVSPHQALICICEALKPIGDLWTTDDEWMVKYKYNAANKWSLVDLKKLALAMLKDMIKLARERLYDTTDEDEKMRACSFPSSYYSSPFLLHLRVQAVRKLNPIDLKHLSFHIFHHAVDQDSRYLFQLSEKHKEEHPEIEATRHSEMTKDMDKFHDVVGDAPETSVKEHSAPGPPPLLPISPKNKATSQTLPPPPHLPPSLASKNPISLPSSPPPPLPIPFTSGNPSCPPTPPPPMTSRNGVPVPPAMAPPPGLAGANNLYPKKATTKLKRSSEMGNLFRHLKGKIEGSSFESKSSGRKGVGCYARHFLEPNDAAQKGVALLTECGPIFHCNHSLVIFFLCSFFFIREFLLSSTSVLFAPYFTPPLMVSGIFDTSTGGKQGMAYALAQMKKRSAYFQQIDEDIENHAKSINDVKSAITSFQTSDMAELIKFHQYLESHLEELTDETQVLTRFEDFPTKKLEALRMAAALHSKLDSVANTLQNWPIKSPFGQLLDKVEKYFNKLKELMVDVSSCCTEVALKVSSDQNILLTRAKPLEKKKNGSAEMLWKAFQFEFRVYTFAGGQDDRADKLTKELAHEIETSSHQ
ncbi:uncharacterized protein LOC111408156 [Olea europaea var. sylvestris]|uniref:uncharacterized protein LOC111408156 n=1 Tax=Olea europaea var. sylvestris TaxID=158386 RepID=UPI000C1D4AF0|nr:uncharacterized protein LOC111408156 [Olea europaea var. sylvestris]